MRWSFKRPGNHSLTAGKARHGRPERVALSESSQGGAGRVARLLSRRCGWNAGAGTCVRTWSSSRRDWSWRVGELFTLELFDELANELRQLQNEND